MLLNKQELVLNLLTNAPLNEADGSDINYSELYRISRVLGISMRQVVKNTVKVREHTPKPRKPRVIR